MKMPRFRVRTLMAIVVVAGLLTWAAMLGARLYDRTRRGVVVRRASAIWGEMAARGHSLSEFDAGVPGITGGWQGNTDRRRGVPGRPSPRILRAPGHPGAEE